jgi:hypothetical protein
MTKFMTPWPSKHCLTKHCASSSLTLVACHKYLWPCPRSKVMSTFLHFYLGLVNIYAYPASNLTAITFLTCNNSHPMGSKVMRTEEMDIGNFGCLLRHGKKTTAHVVNIYDNYNNWTYFSKLMVGFIFLKNYTITINLMNDRNSLIINSKLQDSANGTKFFDTSRSS